MTVHYPKYISMALVVVFGLFHHSIRGSNEGNGVNIVMIFVDDMGYGDLSCYGNPDVNTVRIDRMASEGMRFTRFYTVSPICSPSRVGVTTGSFPGRHQIHSFLAGRKTNRQRLTRDWLDPGIPTVARQFKEAGYATAHFGKWHMGGGRDVGDAPLPQAYGFDESVVAFEGLGDRILVPKRDRASEALGRGIITHSPKNQKTRLYVNRAMEFITKHKEEPFYLHLWLNDVHTGYLPSDEQLARVSTFNGHPWMKKFYAVLLELDAQIGRLIDHIDNHGLDRKTLIVLTSDNGPNLPRVKNGQPEPYSRTGPLRGEKWSLYEGGIRMPCIFRMPGTIPGGMVDEHSIIASVDLFPTFCQMAGVALPNEFEIDGEDFSIALTGKRFLRHKPLMWEYGRLNIPFLRPKSKNNRSPNLAMIDRNWKLLINEDGSDLQLFHARDLTTESPALDVASQFPEAAAHLKLQLLKFYQSLPSTRIRQSE